MITRNRKHRSIGPNLGLAQRAGHAATDHPVATDGVPEHEYHGYRPTDHGGWAGETQDP